MSTTRQRRRAKRRAQSLVFEAIAAADDGDLRLAEALLHRAATAEPRRARVQTESAWLAKQRRQARAASS